VDCIQTILVRTVGFVITVGAVGIMVMVCGVLRFVKRRPRSKNLEQADVPLLDTENPAL
jgi:hypothetical protein